jgi:hypothetical protein
LESGDAVTPGEIGEKIIIWWQLEYDLVFIAFWVSMLYGPLKIPDLLAIIRKHCDYATENRCPEPGEITWHD